LRRASEAKSHGAMKLVQIPRYRAELSVDRACRKRPVVPPRRGRELLRRDRVLLPAEPSEPVRVGG
jgi:hypothetical protein